MPEDMNAIALTGSASVLSVVATHGALWLATDVGLWRGVLGSGVAVTKGQRRLELARICNMSASFVDRDRYHCSAFDSAMEGDPGA